MEGVGVDLEGEEEVQGEAGEPQEEEAEAGVAIDLIKL